MSPMLLRQAHVSHLVRSSVPRCCEWPHKRRLCLTIIRIPLQLRGKTWCQIGNASLVLPASLVSGVRPHAP
jgi:hypothetical protein